MLLLLANQGLDHLDIVVSGHELPQSGEVRDGVLLLPDGGPEYLSLRPAAGQFPRCVFVIAEGQRDRRFDRRLVRHGGRAGGISAKNLRRMRSVRRSGPVECPAVETRHLAARVWPGKAQSWVARANSFARGVSNGQVRSNEHRQMSLAVPPGHEGPAGQMRVSCVSTAANRYFAE